MKILQLPKQLSTQRIAEELTAKGMTAIARKKVITLPGFTVVTGSSQRATGQLADLLLENANVEDFRNMMKAEEGVVYSNDAALESAYAIARMRGQGTRIFVRPIGMSTSDAIIMVSRNHGFVIQ